MTIGIDARSPACPSGVKLGLVIAIALVASVGVAPASAQQVPAAPSPPLPGGAVSSSPPAPGNIREGTMPPGAARLYIVEQSGNTLLVTDYIGRPVYGPGREKVAMITNLLVDTTERAVGIVMNVGGGFLGFGSKEIAIAFEALYPVMEDGKEAFIVEMTKAQLAAAPAFKRSR
jgi:hypothetical protein